MGGETPGLGILEDAREWTVCPADAGADGLRELAVAAGNLVRFIFVPEGDGVPQAARQYNSPDPGDRISGCAVADVTGGDALELIMFEADSRTIRVVGDDDSLLLKLDAGRIDFRGIETPDLNGDGKADVVIKGKDRIGVWLAGQRGAAVVEAGTYESSDKETYLLDVAVGDVNADGAPEMVLIDSGQNSLFIVTVAEDGMRHALKFRVFEEKLFQGSRGGREPHSIKINDLTGDGKQDVVILVHDKIIIYPQ
jgi:hypothetical protein